MAYADAPPVDRLRVGAAVAILHVVLGYALVAGLAVALPPKMAERLAVFALLRPAEPRPVPPPAAVHRSKAPHRAGAAAPPALPAVATPLVSPPPVVVMPVPPRLVVAPDPGPAAADHAGAAPMPGPGSGSGGEGSGSGNGDDGDGPGGGGDGGTPLRWIRGRIKDSDYPRAAFASGIGGTVGLRFVVGVDGRVSECRVTRTSGDAGLDALTCRLIRERFRYRPSRDAAGRPIADVVTGEHEWIPADRD